MEDFSDYMTNNEDSTLAFRAIKDLIGDLKELYPKSTPLALYNRIIQHIKESDSGTGMSKCIDGFKEFFVICGDSLESVELMMQKIPRGTIIKYGSSPKIFVDIQKFIYVADEDSREAIRLHLLTIATILEPNESSLKNLDNSVVEDRANDMLSHLGLDKEGNEYKFLQSTMDDINAAMEGVDSSDPTTAIMGLLPHIPAMMSKLKNKVQDGDLDFEKIMKAAGNFTNMKTPPGMPNFNQMTSMFAQAVATSLDEEPTPTGLESQQQVHECDTVD